MPKRQNVMRYRVSGEVPFVGHDPKSTAAAAEKVAAIAELAAETSIKVEVVSVATSSKVPDEATADQNENAAD